VTGEHPEAETWGTCLPKHGGELRTYDSDVLQCFSMFYMVVEMVYDIFDGDNLG